MSKILDGALVIKDGTVHCGKCNHDLGASADGWKANALVRERPMDGAGGRPYQSRDHVLLRTFLCPNCGRQLAAETAMKDDPYLEDTIQAG